MASRRTCATGWWLLAVIFSVWLMHPAVGAPMLPQDVSLDKESSDESLTSSEEIPTTTDGGDDEKTAAGEYRDDVVPLETEDERTKFLTTLLMLENLQEGHGVKTAHPDRLASQEAVMSELFKLYQDTQAFHGKHYLKIPAKLMKKMRKKMKEIMAD